MIGPLLHWLSPAGRAARLSILIFHRVAAQPDPLFPGEIDAAHFDALCARLRQGWQVLPLAAAVQRLRDGTLPARALAITFDDGYADNHDVALPVLQRHGLNATFFVAAGFLDGGRMWNDTVIEALRRWPGDSLDAGALGLPGLQRLSLDTLDARRAAIGQVIGAIKYLEPVPRAALAQRLAEACGVALPDDLMMRTAQLRALHRAGMGIGGHTLTHPILARLAADAARAEITGGKQRLEELLQSPVTLFAYPNGRPGGDYTAESVALVRQAGFEAAVSTAWGAADGRTDPWQLPRFTPWDRAPLAFELRMARNFRHPVKFAPAATMTARA